MLTQNQKLRKGRGFTLTEAAIVLGIVGLILGAIWVAAASVYDNLRVSKTSEQLLNMVQSIRSMHATQNTVTGITEQLVGSAGGIPSDMLTKDGSGNVTFVRDIWNGLVDIAAYTHTTAGDSFSISFAAVPKRACMDLLVRNTGVGRDTGLIGAAAAAGDNSANFPITLSIADGICSTDSNTVVFTFRLKA